MNTVIKIKTEACILFSSKGYKATSMREIAGKVGIKASSIYSYYPSKKILFFEIFIDSITKYALAIHSDAGLDNSSPREKLLIILQNKIRFSKESPSTIDFLMRNIFFPPEELKEELSELISEKGDKTYLQNYNEIYGDLKNQDSIRSNLDLTQFISSFQRVFIGYVTQNLGLNYYDSKESIEDIFSIYWEGIKNKD